MRLLVRIDENEKSLCRIRPHGIFKSVLPKKSGKIGRFDHGLRHTLPIRATYLPNSKSVSYKQSKSPFSHLAHPCEGCGFEIVVDYYLLSVLLVSVLSKK